MNVEKTKESMANEMSKTQDAIGQLLEVDEMNKKLECQIDCKDEEPTNLSVLKLRFPNLPKSMKTKSEIEIRWFRSHFNDMLPIEGAKDSEYHVCADDIGSVLKGEVRSVKLKDCYSSAVIGPIRLSSESKNKVHESLGRIIKKEIEFNLTPNLSDSKTGEKLKGSKQVLLHFNRDKVKIRDSKNHTFDKEIYNRQMRVSLMADNPLQFKFKLKKGKEYSFLARSVAERDDIAILLRAYYMQLENAKDPKLKLSFYLRLANEIDLDSKNVLGNKTGEMLLSRDQLVSKILAPISSKRSFGNGVQPPLSENSLNSQMSQPRSTRLAPVSNNREESVSGFSGKEETYDVEALFPDMPFGDLDSVRGSSARSGPVSPQQGSTDDFFKGLGMSSNDNNNNTNNNDNAANAKSPKGSKKRRSKNKNNGKGDTSGNTNNNNNNATPGNDNSENTDETASAENAEEPKKVWKGLQFSDNVKAVSDEQLRAAANSFAPAPPSSNSKPKTKGRKKRKGKKKSKKNEKGNGQGVTKDEKKEQDQAPPQQQKQEKQQQPQQAQSPQITVTQPNGTALEKKKQVIVKGDKSLGMSIVMEDRVDCLMGLDGKIVKFQIVGSLALHFATKLHEDRILTLKLFNLPNAKIFSPKRVKQTVDEDIIQVKCVKDDESINVAKYKWKCDDPSKVCPLKMSLKYDNIENDSICIVTCHVEKQSSMADVSVSQLRILGTIEMDNKNGKITECLETEPKKMEIADCEFHWSKGQMAHKFMFKLGDDSVLKTGKTFVCKFAQQGGKVSKVTVKPTFEINNFGLSTILVNGGKTANDKMIEDSDNKRRVVSGEYIITDQS